MVGKIVKIETSFSNKPSAQPPNQLVKPANGFHNISTIEISTYYAPPFCYYINKKLTQSKTKLTIFANFVYIFCIFYVFMTFFAVILIILRHLLHLLLPCCLMVELEI